MKQIPTRRFRRAYRTAVLISVCAVTPLVTFAAEPNMEPEITVSAERPASKVVGRTASGIPIRLYLLSYNVSYADLDVTTSAGADELRKRVNDAAKSACKDLDKLYPEIDPDPSCARKAAENSMAQMDRAIKFAQMQSSAH